MRPGDVYQLLDDIGEISAGLYAIVDVGMMVELSRLWKNEYGDYSPTGRNVKVTRQEMEQFVWLEETVDLMR